jgi:nucleosome binding factor SPN SPT16 subunit
VQDIKFIREASDVQFDETSNRKRKHRYDEDEIEMEQQERKRRLTLNRELKNSRKGSQKQLQRPYVQLQVLCTQLLMLGIVRLTNLSSLISPSGNFRSKVSHSGPTFGSWLPTTDCLVHLTDPPFLVVTLSDIEIASLERVKSSLKQFDLVLTSRGYPCTLIPSRPHSLTM